jgi:hypothetical protein
LTDDDFRPGRIWCLPSWKKKAAPIDLELKYKEGDPERAASGIPPTPAVNPARSRKGGMARAKQLKEQRRRKFDANTVVLREGV